MKKEFDITRDEDRCVGCKECIIVCPQSGDDKDDPVIVPSSKEGAPPEIHCIENCIQCMTCWDFCRSRAIIFNNHHEVQSLIENEAAFLKVGKIV
jgi:formate hydrogenlyase subunit 6/NADH:ubiquinone oxidoreductase subunit I